MFSRIKLILTGILLVLILSLFPAKTNAWSINDEPISFTIVTFEGSPEVKIPKNYSNVSGLAVAADGSIYVLDKGGRIEKLDSNYNHLLYIGSEGSGDGQFNSPSDIVVNSVGHIFVSDTGNNRVQEFDASGNFVRKFGSSGTSNGQFVNPSVLAIDSSNNIYVGDRQGTSTTSRIQKFSSTGSFLSNLSVTHYYGKGFDLDSLGNLYYISDPSATSDRVYLYKYESGVGDTELSLISDMYGGDSTEFTPVLTIDGNNNIYVYGSRGDPSMNYVLKYSTAGTNLSGFAPYGTSNGKVYAGTLYDLTTDSANNVYVSDSYHVIQKFSSSGAYISKFGTQGILNAAIYNPYAVQAGNDGKIYIINSSPTYTYFITILNSDGTFNKNINAGAIDDTSIFSPISLAVDSQGNIYVLDVTHNSLRKLSASGNVLFTKIGSCEDETTRFCNASRMSIDKNNYLYISNEYTSEVIKLDSSGNYVSSIGNGSGAGDGQFNAINQTAFDSNNNIYVADSNNQRVSKFSPSGQFLMEFGTPGTAADEFEADAIFGLSVDSYGYIYVGNRVKKTVQVFNPDGEYINSFGSSDSSEGGIINPGSLSFGSNGYLYVADNGDDGVNDPTANPKTGLLVMVFDRLAPTVTLTSSNVVVNKKAIFKGIAEDAFSIVTAVDLKTDSGEWISCTSEDGSFNSVSEVFVCQSSILAAGNHDVYIRAVDNKGNIGTGDVLGISLSNVTSDNDADTENVNQSDSNNNTENTDDEGTSELFTLVIYDKSNRPLEGANVEIDGQSYTTDEEGRVSFEIVPGTYAIKVSFEGDDFESEMRFVVGHIENSVNTDLEPTNNDSNDVESEDKDSNSKNNGNSIKTVFICVLPLLLLFIVLFILREVKKDRTVK